MQLVTMSLQLAEVIGVKREEHAQLKKRSTTRDQLFPLSDPLEASQIGGGASKAGAERDRVVGTDAVHRT